MNEELLRPYQTQGINWLKKQNNCLLCDEQGIGKSCQLLFSLDVNYGTIIVSPTQVLYNWVKEIQFWRPEFKHFVVSSKKEFRLPEIGEIVIVSYGMLPEWVSPPKGKRKVNIPDDIIQKFKTTYIVFDEFHRAANPKSKTSRNCKYITRLCFKAIGMTGTPLRNSPYDLWILLNVLGIEKKVFRDFFHFLKSYHGKKGFFGWTFPKDPKVSPEISTLLSSVMLRRTKDEVNLELPDHIYVPIYVNDPGLKKELNSAWELLRSLKEFSKGEIPDFGEMSKAKLAIAKSNIPIMLETVKEYEELNIPLIVASDHVDPIKTLKEREGWDIIIGGMSPEEKFKVSQNFQNGKLKGVGVVLKAGSEGINLFYGSHILFNDRHWTPSVNEQFIARIDRIGQKQKKIFIKDIICDHPLTQLIYQQNIKKMILSKDSMEKNEGFEILKSDKEKTVDNLTKEVIKSCLPEWEKRFENFEEEDISDIDSFLKDYEFKTESAKSIISLLSIFKFEDKLLISLAKKVINADKNAEK